MKKKLFTLLLLPPIAAVLWLIGAPILAWLRCFFPGLSGGLFWALFLFSIFAFFFSFPLPPSRLRSALHAYGELINAPLQTLTVFLAAAWLAWLVWPGLPVRETGWVVLAAYAPLGAYGAWNALRVRRKDYTILLDKPCPRLRVALVSDLHLGVFSDRRMMGRIARAVEDCEPDLVLVAGDIFDDRFEALRHPEAALAALRELTARYPVYACGGNHDLLAPSPAREDFLRAAGLRVLADETLDWRGVTLVFRRDIREKTRLTEEELLAGADKRRPVLVVDHSPARYRALWAAGADLVLSGHTHGGQTFPGTLFYKLSPVLPYGHREAGGRHVVVTSGAGLYGLPLRLGVHSEVALLTLRGREG